MWKNKARTLLSAILCVSVMATGASADRYFASDENGSSTPPAAIDSITVSTEDIHKPEIEWDEMLKKSRERSEISCPAFSICSAVLPLPPTEI